MLNLIEGNEASIQDFESIISAIRAFHKTGNVAQPPTGVTVVKGKSISIDYGYNSARSGTVVLAYGQLELTQVTDARGVLQTLTSYNHSGGSFCSPQDYINSLKCNNLYASTNSALVSGLIILTSECSRSEMVLEAIKALFTKSVKFTSDEWAGLVFAFTTYGKTAGFKGYNITAGNQNWAPLQAADYTGYINTSGFTGDKTQATKSIDAVVQYVATES